jgi:hypothetical protein
MRTWNDAELTPAGKVIIPLLIVMICLFYLDWLQIIAVAIIIVLVRLRYWLYWGRGRWIGVPIPDNVIQFPKKQDHTIDS